MKQGFQCNDQMFGFAKCLSPPNEHIDKKERRQQISI